MKRLMFFTCVLFAFVWGSQGVSPVLAQESGKAAQVAPAGQPGPSTQAPAATEERAPMQKVGRSCASFGKKTGDFFGTSGKKTGSFFKNAGVKTGRFFKGLFVKE